jgi:leucyl aminopeptidase
MTPASVARTFSFFGASQKIPALDSGDIECVVLPKDRIRTAVQKLSSAGAGRWDKDALAQYARKLEEGDEKAQAASVRVNTSGGGASIFLFAAPKISTFELHGEIRKAFAEAMDHPRKLRLDVSRLDADNQKRALLALSFLAETASWKPTVFGQRKEAATKDDKKPRPPIEVVSGLARDAAAKIARRGATLGLANNRVRTLADLPANELNPRAYRIHAEKFAKAHGLGFEFWDIEELRRRKAGAFLAVTRADPKSEGGIAVVRYKPKRSAGAKDKLLTLVGKGICFDTGGYNLKPGSSMLGMHGDMTGSAIALALCAYFAEMEAPFEVHAYLGLAENLISSTAYRPNEVVIASDGTSIEVVDTDAEGRMILSDTLALAARAKKPSLLIDFATLTGAAIRALDTRRGAVFSNRKDLANLAVYCGDVSGERTWTFPIGEDYRAELKSKIADILQCAPGNNADHIYAATFLSHFAGKDTPWVHLDLVPAENKGGLGLIASDTTGFGVLWADEFVREAL